MFIEAVHLQNYRAFAGEHTIPIDRRLTVFAGLNGAGKSTVLDAIGSVLFGVASYLCEGPGACLGVGEMGNITHGAYRAKWGLTLAHGSAEPVEYEGESYRGSRPPHKPPADRGFLAELRPDLACPVLAYLRSSSTRSPQRHADPGPNKSDGLMAYVGAFDGEPHRFADLEAWFEQEENLENQEKIRQGDLKVQLHSLRLVRGCLGRFFSALQGNDLHSIRVLRQHIDGPDKPARGRIVIGKGDQELFLDQLSDGERRLALIVLDVARRQAMLSLLSRDGILLIDEIDLHLHPRWQRTAIAALQAAFPDFQLIVSSHAPLVLNSVPNSSLRILNNGALLPGPTRVYGAEPNTIIEGLQGTPLRPTAVQEKLDALFAAIDATPEQAGPLVEELEGLIDRDDPDLVRARTLIALLSP